MMRLTALIFFFCVLYKISNAQKPAIDSSAYQHWSSVSDGQLSPDGRYVMYKENDTPIGSSTTVIRSLAGNWRISYVGATSVMMTEDSKWVFILRNDSLWRQMLGGDEKTLITGIKSFQLIGLRLLYATSQGMKMQSLQTGDIRTLGNVISEALSPSKNLLIYQTATDSGHSYQLHCLALSSGDDHVIWSGSIPAHNFILDDREEQIAFLTIEKGSCLWYHRRGMDSAERWISDGVRSIDSNLMINEGERMRFSKDGRRLLFYLKEKEHKAVPELGVAVDIWSYMDVLLPPQQKTVMGPFYHSYLASISVGKSQVVRLMQTGEFVLSPLEEINKYVLISSGGGVDLWWLPTARPSFYLVSTIDGNRRTLGEHLPYTFSNRPEFELSPDEKYIFYYDPYKKNYYSYDLATENIQNMTMGIGQWKDTLVCDFPDPTYARPVGTAGWWQGDSSVLLYDNYDIWEADIHGRRRPWCLTGGYGRRNNIQLRLPGQWAKNDLSPNQPLLLTAYNERTKEGGFYRYLRGGKLEELSMSPYQFSGDYHAQGMQKSWLITQQSAEEAPNYFVTEDFRHFSPISDVQPQRAYNWLKASLMEWRLSNGKLCQAMLFRPENFDSSKQYPVIFTYYERQSEDLFRFRKPHPSGDAEIDIPFYVSRGYIVCVPDIIYQVGHPGKSALEIVESAARFLTRQPWVDARHLGIDGHSWGGYETAFIVTHSKSFAAAAEGAGVTDFLSEYGGIYGAGMSKKFLYETGQCRIGAPLWAKKDLYFENSPVLFADRVVTPLLILHNAMDRSVSFSQGTELFTALRRLQKKAWMLQYDREGHGLNTQSNELDFTIRMSQFFDHYLKDSPAPKWMTEGVPTRLKGTETGYELDFSGRNP